MKRSLIMIATMILVLALVLSFGITGCTTEETTTQPPATTTQPPATTTQPPETTTQPPETTTPPPETTTAEPINISWEDAAGHIGELATVEGPIIDMFDTGSGYVLGMGVSIMEANTVGIEINYTLAAELPADLYVGQTIKITGTPYTNPYGGASIVVEDASKIEVVGGELPPETTTPPEETTTPPEETTTPPEETTTPAGPVVYVSVSVDGELLVAAQPVTYTEGMTVEAVILAAHAEFYSGGESGYTAGIDPIWGMYLISQCWGVENTPYIIINDTPLGATAPEYVNATSVAANDNIIICTGSDTSTISPVALTATVSGDSVTVTATAWTLSFATFTYSSAPLANANVIDPTTGESLGTTDDNGQITITIPESGVVAIEGMAAINVTASAT